MKNYEMKEKKDGDNLNGKICMLRNKAMQTLVSKHWMKFCECIGIEFDERIQN